MARSGIDSIGIANRYRSFGDRFEVPMRGYPVRSNPQVGIHSRQSYMPMIATYVLDNPVQVFLIADNAVETLSLPDRADLTSTCIDCSCRDTFPPLENLFQGNGFRIERPSN